jgi:microcystin synthetase protein McyA
MVDLSGVSEEELLERISQEADQWQRTLNLDAGPLCRFVYFECGEGRSNRLLIVIHHLVIDGVSWRIVLEDLWQLYQQAKAGERLELAAKTNTVQQWGEYLERLAGEGAFKGEMEYWLGAVEERGEEVRRMPVDNREGSNLQADVGVVQRALSRERTRELVQEVPGVYGTQIQEVLLTALEQAWRRWSGRGGEVLVEVEGHGREWVEEERQEAGAGGEGETGDGRAQSRGGAEIDVTRTVGWFTTIYPVRLRVRERSHAGEAIKEVKEQMRRVPRGGLGYGVLRYLSEEEEVRAKMEAVGGAEVLFNYLGQFEDRAGSGNKAEESAEGRVEGSVEGFELTGESSGAGRDEEGERHHVLVINAVIAGGRLQMEWEYSMGRQRRERVEEMAREYEEELEKLIEHCVGEDAGGYTPSDFFLADLPQDELDKAVLEVDFESR